MVSKERISELYHDVICKCYCDIEVPSAVLEKLNKDGGTQTDTLRTIMIDRIQNAANTGVVKISAEELTAICDDLRRGPRNKTAPNGSANLYRIYKKFRLDAGFAKSSSEYCFSVTGKINNSLKDLWARQLVAHRETHTGLTSKIVTEWLMNQKSKEVQSNG